jgi:hypothetical protein
MHWLLLAISLLSVLAAAAIANPEAVPGTKTPLAAEVKPSSGSEASKPQSPSAEGKRSGAEIRKLGEEYYQQCLKDWDAATHMTKKEWQRTCRRIVDDRVKFMAE